MEYKMALFLLYLFLLYYDRLYYDLHDEREYSQ
jgi:hypothetical protein